MSLLVENFIKRLQRYNCVLRPRWTVVLRRDIGTRDPKTGQYYTEVPARAECEEWGGVWSDRIRGYVWIDDEQAWQYAFERNDHMSLNSRATVVRVY